MIFRPFLSIYFLLKICTTVRTDKGGGGGRVVGGKWGHERSILSIHSLISRVLNAQRYKVFFANSVSDRIRISSLSYLYISLIRDALVHASQENDENVKKLYVY